MCLGPTAPARLLAAETFFHSYQGASDCPDSEVNFDTPVNITEVKILAPGDRVVTRHGAVLIGATEPFQFPIQFLCHNIDEKNPSAHVHLGSFNYIAHERSNLACDTDIWTQKLLVRGRFTGLTVLVYGRPKNPYRQSVQSQSREANVVSISPLPIRRRRDQPLPPSILDNDENHTVNANAGVGLSGFSFDSAFF